MGITRNYHSLVQDIFCVGRHFTIWIKIIKKIKSRKRLLNITALLSRFLKFEQWE